MQSIHFIEISYQKLLIYPSHSPQNAAFDPKLCISPNITPIKPTDLESTSL